MVTCSIDIPQRFQTKKEKESQIKSNFVKIKKKKKEQTTTSGDIAK